MEPDRLKKLRDLFVVFFKASSFTFAGGLAILPLLEKDLIDDRHYMDRDEFLEYVALCQTLPGVITINCASFVGARIAGAAGAFVAAFAAVLPAYTIMLIATILLKLLPQSPVIVGVFAGVRAASAALIMASVFSLGKKQIKMVFAMVVSAAVFAAVLFFDIDALPLVLAAGLAGVIYEALKRKKA